MSNIAYTYRVEFELILQLNVKYSLYIVGHFTTLALSRYNSICVANLYFVYYFNYGDSYLQNM